MSILKGRRFASSRLGTGRVIGFPYGLTAFYEFWRISKADTDFPLVRSFPSKKAEWRHTDILGNNRWHHSKENHCICYHDGILWKTENDQRLESNIMIALAPIFCNIYLWLLWRRYRKHKTPIDGKSVVKFIVHCNLISQGTRSQAAEDKEAGTDEFLLLVLN